MQRLAIPAVMLTGALEASVFEITATSTMRSPARASRWRAIASEPRRNSRRLHRSSRATW